MTAFPYLNKGTQACFHTDSKDPRKGGFHTDLRIVDECGEKPKVKPIIYFSNLANAKKDGMMEAYPHKEWLAYLQGTKEGDNWSVYDIEVPLQITTGGSVETDPDNSRPKDCIGTIHSHGKSDSKTGFSGVDEDFLIENYHVSIVTTGQNMTGSVKISVPCGSFMVVEAPVIVKYPDPDIKNWLADAKKKIHDPPPKTVAVTTTNGKGNNGVMVNCSICKEPSPFDITYVLDNRMVCPDCMNRFYS